MRGSWRRPRTAPPPAKDDTRSPGRSGVGSRITRRLHRTAKAARRISTGDLDARVRDPSAERPGRARDEAAAVAAALDAMAAGLQAGLHSEQRFTADVAHELRTPLAGLHGAAGLLPPGRPADMVRDRAGALIRLTEGLLEISRLDARVEQADLDVHRLGPLAERAVRATGRSGGAEGGRRTGHGLGLTIATGQAHVLGATLRFTNAPDGGALAELRLPSHPAPPPAEPLRRLARSPAAAAAGPRR